MEACASEDFWGVSFLITFLTTFFAADGNFAFFLVCCMVVEESSELLVAWTLLSLLHSVCWHFRFPSMMSSGFTGSIVW